jgi:hypothetical protein
MWEFPIIEDPGFGHCPFNCPIMNSSDFCAPNGDSYFGPQVEPCLRSFDFTLRFENLFLSIAPSVLFLLIAPVRIFTLRNEQKRVVGGSTFQIVKLVSISITGGFPLTSKTACDCIVRHFATRSTGAVVSRAN